MDRSYEITKEALRQTELRLEDLEKYLTSLERRVGWFVTASVSFAALQFLYADKLSNQLLSVICGVLLIINSLIMIKQTIPTSFHCRGHFWEDWKGHISDDDSIELTLASQAKENDQRIRENEAHLQNVGRNFRNAFAFAYYLLCFFLGSQISPLFS